MRNLKQLHHLSSHHHLHGEINRAVHRRVEIIKVSEIVCLQKRKIEAKQTHKKINSIRPLTFPLNLGGGQAAAPSAWGNQPARAQPASSQPARPQPASAPTPAANRSGLSFMIFLIKYLY